MATNIQDSYCLPLQETIVHNNKTARTIELVVLSLLVFVLVYRVVYFNDQDQYLPWLLAFLCESWFTFNWTLSVCIKWNQSTTITYPDRLFKRVSESEFPTVDIFVTTADAVLEPSIIAMNTVLSLLAVDYPADKLALYLSDDGCSPLTLYSLVETTKFAKLWVPFCKKYKVQVRAPFRYFDSKSTPMKDDSLEFQQEWKKMKREYGELYKKIEFARQRPFPCDHDPDFGVFCGVHRSDHPTIIKVISENKEGIPSDPPHVIYISREKNPKHKHHYKAGAMNVLTRVSGVMTNAPLMLNVDCDMYANNPQVFLHAMCLVFGFKDEDNCAFFQFPQAFYDGLKDDPFGNQLANLFYVVNGVASNQGTVYSGTNCFHRRKVIYGASPNDTIKSDNISNEDLHKIFGKSIELRESAAHILSESNSKIENRNSPSSFIEAAIHVASCSYEYGTSWGTQVGWLYGSTTEDVLTGLSIHGRGWRSAITSPDPLAFLGCAPLTFPSSLTQQKRWIIGLFEILFTDKNPLLLATKGNLWFRQALGYFSFSLWAIRSVFELCYASLPVYCIITGSRFLPKIDEWAFLIFMAIFVIYNLYVYWECKRVGVSLRMWWNLQRIERVNAMTAWLFGFLNVMLKFIGLSDTIFEVTQKEHKSNDGGNDDDNESVGKFTYDKSPMIIPGVVILLVNIVALVNGVLRLLKVDYSENWVGVLELGLGEMFVSVWLLLCFWEFFKGLFRNGKYGIPSSTIWKSGALALLFVQLCRRSP
ncbi:putative cellulose synthase (UDP-forming) [Helianthus annuus]|uniref:Cellulose synthase (UDP-forming) n=1 Tax=Helianthus annuus TaxID=4232 RepID=A0A251RXA7_HELAN|nr:cellulose synthase-like protein H1 [Helianthus annuus]KAF5758817.1 putative cellulose synthase (UDP-forming) [Helianthus annuus]KAJ0437108.1 putative cellulose synthase (UDP-forming) [Helianthus annuus]KAJ0459420.1 putative cellulose synthase (UDP-forming) [Helianthus annuus]KAJ0639949.1 putative cellulose synthase (UDP-forming) [Helianthus annuus]KAJ0643903.1 putative cellulose synthase (UDP-forming) [Helianthus annuus]